MRIKNNETAGNKHVDPQAILRLYDQEMRKDAPAGLDSIYQQPGLTFIATSAPGSFAGWVICTHLDPSTADQAIRSTINFFHQHGSEFEWKVYDHDTPPDLKVRLLGHGFVAEDLEALLVLDMESVPASFWEPASCSVQRLSTPQQLAEVTQIESQVWGEPSVDLESMLSTEMQDTPEQISVYVAYVDGEPASSAWIRFYPERQFAELYGGATLPGQRGKGLYTALVKVRAQEARQRGVRFLAVDTSPMSRPVLEKLGFMFLTNTQPFLMKFNSA